MTRKKTLPTITKPFAHVHNILSTMGFKETGSRDGCKYELMFRDPVTTKEYPFCLNTLTVENGQTQVDLNSAGFICKEPVPESVSAAADEILSELQQYLENGPAKIKSAPIDQAMNTMANNEEEVKRLGKSMAKLPTNTQVRQSGMIPDPVQYD
ncbi:MULTISPECIES: hypothetical protein [unclassified Paenibacillus]|uniref:hypothetical protein n=1 Tax=unclassified Paenibacillus TaxID=185978 RepID=UPI001AE66FED|nr:MULTISPECIES: hypothetical protein [unclassified Paenibacillus]MBP1153405.1 hypothetical protein [Paenibacillus sp. PvP091]MBP1171212.1 hypothetical protein [Paenibacillus sp. PvR098]MBP2442240.1 hypothetical protein [Paenibacillus sp. PvP052]